MTENSVEPVLTLEELSALLGRSADWWARKARKREVPHVRIGKSIRFSAKNVAEIVAKFEVQAVTGPASVVTVGADPSASPMGLTPRSAARARGRAGRAG